MMVPMGTRVSEQSMFATKSSMPLGLGAINLPQEAVENSQFMQNAASTDMVLDLPDEQSSFEATRPLF
jgi:hypothetical protein